MSCPTCGRTQINLIALANRVEDMVADIPLDIKVAVMGCVVTDRGKQERQTSGLQEESGKDC